MGLFVNLKEAWAIIFVPGTKAARHETIKQLKSGGFHSDKEIAKAQLKAGGFIACDHGHQGPSIGEELPNDPISPPPLNHLVV